MSNVTAPDYLRGYWRERAAGQTQNCDGPDVALYVIDGRYLLVWRETFDTPRTIEEYRNFAAADKRWSELVRM